MKRTPLKRKTPLARGKKGLRRTPLRRRSKKLSIEMIEYNIEKAIYLKAHPWCNAEALVAAKEDRWPVQTPSEDVHHRMGRRGKLLRDQSYWLPVSRKNHAFIEANKKWAREVGLVLYK